MADMTAADLLPGELLALKMARAQLERGENPPFNTTGTLIEALERVTAAVPGIAEAERERLASPKMRLRYAAAFCQLIDPDEAVDCAFMVTEIISGKAAQVSSLAADTTPEQRA